MTTEAQRHADRAKHLIQVAGVHLAGGRIEAALVCLSDFADLAEHADPETKARASKMLDGITAGKHRPTVNQPMAAKAADPRRHIKVNKANRRRRKLFLRAEFARLIGREGKSHAYAERETQCSHWEACTTVRYLKRNGILPNEARR